MVEPSIKDLDEASMEGYLQELYAEMRPLNERIQYLHNLAEQIHLERIRRRRYVAISV